MQIFQAIITLAFTLIAPALLAGTLTVKDPWIPEAPPNARMLAGYMELHNHGEDVVRIVDARAESWFGNIEIHISETQDGLSRMRKIDLLEIPPGQSALLQRGGLHLMLMRPKRSPAVGDQITIELLDDAGQVAVVVEAEVRPRP